MTFIRCHPEEPPLRSHVLLISMAVTTGDLAQEGSLLSVVLLHLASPLSLKHLEDTVCPMHCSVISMIFSKFLLSAFPSRVPVGAYSSSIGLSVFGAGTHGSLRRVALALPCMSKSVKLVHLKGFQMAKSILGNRRPWGDAAYGCSTTTKEK